MRTHRFVAAATLIFLLGCASTPAVTPPIAIEINGQTIDRQFRELVVRATNSGPSTLDGVRLEVSLPSSLPLLRESHSTGVRLRSSATARDARLYVYALPPLAPGATASAHFPFRTQALGILEGQRMNVVARAGRGTVEASRAF